MACHWIKFKDKDGVEHTAHVNMRGPRRRKCAFCDCPDAKALCDYPVMRAVPFHPYDAIGVDDVLAQPGTGWRARIVSLEMAADANCLLVAALVLEPRIRMSIRIGPENYRRFHVERPATCDKPCCWRCRQHVGPDRDYCADHWDFESREAQAKLWPELSLQEDLF